MMPLPGEFEGAGSPLGKAGPLFAFYASSCRHDAKAHRLLRRYACNGDLSGGRAGRNIRREAAMLGKALRNYLQHRLNPAHVYCRLRGLGLNKAKARLVSCYYAKVYTLTWLG